MALGPPVKPDYGRFLDRGNDLRLLRYLQGLRDRLGLMGTPGLPERDERTEVPIDRLYVPLGVTWTETDAGGAADAAPRARQTRLAEVLVAARQRVVLLGEAGSGKTTFTTWLVRRLAERARNEVHERIGELVPLHLVLRDLPLTEQVRTPEALLDLLRASEAWTPGLDEALPALLDAGQVLFVLDGWDEVADTGLRLALRGALRGAMDRFPACTFLLTSRPEGYDEVPLEEPAEDQVLVRASILPLEPDQVEALARTWYQLRDPAPALARTAALLAGLRADPALAALATSPQLLSLLALVQGPRPLPADRSELLERVVETFIEGWAAAPGQPRPAAPPALRRRWLEELALEMNRRRVWGATQDELDRLPDANGPMTAGATRLQSGTVVRRDRALDLVTEHAQDGLPGGGPDHARAFLDWCLRRSGLLVPRSETTLAFAHLLLQDWLCTGALRRRLLSAWHEPELARGTARELSRWTFRAAGGPSILLLLERLRPELPDLADQLAVELFRERAARPEEHRRLLDLARQADCADLLLPDMEATAQVPWRRPDRARVLEAVDRVPPEALHCEGLAFVRCPALTDLGPLAGAGELRALYLVDCPGIVDLTPLGNHRGEGPTRRTLYAKRTAAAVVPPGLPWRVVDEAGLVYTPEDGRVGG